MTRTERKPLLELGTKPFCLRLADEGAGKRREGEVEVGAALVADDQPAEASQPGQRALSSTLANLGGVDRDWVTKRA